VVRAAAKRREKHADLIVANDVSRADAGFDVGTNAVTLVSAERTETLPLQSKAQIAAAILDRVETLMSKRPARAASPR
jgi:phosphopantothenoylcysteine decarboxylase/phosphopantothenate--cysteine ligase